MSYRSFNSNIPLNGLHHNRLPKADSFVSDRSNYPNIEIKKLKNSLPSKFKSNRNSSLLINTA